MILVVLLGVTALVARSCGGHDNNVSQDEAVALAIEHASFVPCKPDICRQVRFLQQGVPPVGYWGVVLSKHVNAQGIPDRTESFLVNASTGTVEKQ